MKTIVQVVQHLSPGGIETMALDLATWHGKDEQTFIISLEGESASAMQAWPRLKPYADRILFMNKADGVSLGTIARLSSLLKRLSADVVHTHHIGPLLYGGTAARLAGVRTLIHTEHDAWHLENAGNRRKQKLLISLLRPTLVADARIVAENMSRLLDTDDITIIHNGIDTRKFIPGDQHNAREHLGLPVDVTLIGSSGRLEPVKGHRTLIDAMSRLPAHVHLAIAGAGSLEGKLRAMTADLDLADRIHFLGRIDSMPAFYQALDLFCLPSLNEGFPLSPLEAQSCNIPSVVTDVGGSSETLCRDSGALVVAEDADALAQTLEASLVNRTTTEPRKFVQDFADVKQMAAAYAALS